MQYLSMNNKLKISCDACGEKTCNTYVQLALCLDHRCGRIVQISLLWGTRFYGFTGLGRG